MNESEIAEMRKTIREVLQRHTWVSYRAMIDALRAEYRCTEEDAVYALHSMVRMRRDV